MSHEKIKNKKFPVKQLSKVVGLQQELPWPQNDHNPIPSRHTELCFGHNDKAVTITTYKQTLVSQCLLTAKCGLNSEIPAMASSQTPSPQRTEVGVV